MDLTKQFKERWTQLAAGRTSPVLLAISGGLDSMVMAHLFKDAGFSFAVAHCNFGLRGDESDGDEAFVSAWCAVNVVPFFSTHFDTAAAAASSGKGIQETARDLRYAWFEVIRKEHGFSAICTAHHADDNAETMLINFLRGTGIAGLHGIPARNGQVLRPLLFATRNELATYAADHQIAYREDSSNGGDDYLRNAIRHRLLPVAEELMPGVAQRLLDTSGRLSEAEQLYRKAVAQECRHLLEQRGADYYVPLRKLRNRTPLATICYELFRPFGFTAHQIPFITEDLLHAESGRYMASPTHRLIRNRNFLIVTAAATEATDLIVLRDMEQEKTVATATGSFHFSLLEKAPHVDTDPNIACIDAAKLDAPLLLRRWKTGDYFYPLGMGMKKKKLSRFFIDQKLPLHQKEKVWVLESNRRIVWVAGLRLDERFKITPATLKTLQVKLQRAD